MSVISLSLPLHIFAGVTTCGFRVVPLPTKGTAGGGGGVQVLLETVLSTDQGRPATTNYQFKAIFPNFELPGMSDNL